MYTCVRKKKEDARIKRYLGKLCKDFKKDDRNRDKQRSRMENIV